MTITYTVYMKVPVQIVNTRTHSNTKLFLVEEKTRFQIASLSKTICQIHAHAFLVVVIPNTAAACMCAKQQKHTSAPTHSHMLAPPFRVDARGKGPRPEAPK
eukprot:GEMP01076807.1.p2 GENE.GEMP01076807.1~~GEMP01076807.1.p2  ORF type:complete len:102 (-),score=3.98 GEMP01076807.1:716-1021(-)